MEALYLSIFRVQYRWRRVVGIGTNGGRTPGIIEPRKLQSASPLSGLSQEA